MTTKPIIAIVTEPTPGEFEVILNLRFKSESVAQLYATEINNSMRNGYFDHVDVETLIPGHRRTE